MKCLEGYETVKERKKRFYADHPDGSLISDLIYHEKGHVIIKGLAFRTKEEQEKNLPSGVGYAEEFQGQGGFANKFSWMENCDESAIGRALDNAGYSGNGKCSREEMEKVERHENKDEKINAARERLKVLSDDTKEGLRIIGYNALVADEFCQRFGYDEKRIKHEINIIIDSKGVKQ